MTRLLLSVALLACLTTRSFEAQATQLHGEVDGLITRSGVVPPGQFGLEVDPSDPFVNNGLPVAVRFSLDTDLLPPDQASDPALVYYEEANPAAAWLQVEIEINGVVVPIDANYLLFEEGTLSGEGGADLVHFVASSVLPSDATVQGVDVTVLASSFGFGPGPWTDLEVSSPDYNSPGTYSEIYPPDFEAGYFVDFAATHLSQHPVPEPGIAAFVLAASLLAWRARR